MTKKIAMTGKTSQKINYQLGKSKYTIELDIIADILLHSY